MAAVRQMSDWDVVKEGHNESVVWPMSGWGMPEEYLYSVTEVWKMSKWGLQGGE